MPETCPVTAYSVRTRPNTQTSPPRSRFAPLLTVAPLDGYTKHGFGLSASRPHNVSFFFRRPHSLLPVRGCCDPVASSTCWSATAKKAAVVAAYYQPGQAVGAAGRRDNSIRL